LCGCPEEETGNISLSPSRDRNIRRSEFERRYLSTNLLGLSLALWTEQTTSAKRLLFKNVRESTAAYILIRFLFINYDVSKISFLQVIFKKLGPRPFAV
jgi:hypothetical protein